MKLYTFLDEEENIIEQVRAEYHSEALERATNNSIEFTTDFYSEELEREWTCHYCGFKGTEEEIREHMVQCKKEAQNK